MTILSANLAFDANLERVCAPKSHIPRWTFTLVFLLLVTSLLGRMVYLLYPLDSDSAVFIYMGKLAAQGAPYWDEFRDNKLPSVGLVMSVLWRVFGICWPAYLLTGLLLSVGSSALLARCAARHIRPQAWLPTFVFSLVYLNLNYAVYGGFELETVQSFFCVLAFSAGMEAVTGGRALDSFVVGLAAGFAAWLKPTGLGVAGVVWLGLMLTTRRHGRDARVTRMPARDMGVSPMRRGGRWIIPALLSQRLTHTLALLLGASIPLSALLVYLWWTRLLPILPEIIRETKRYASETPWDWTDLYKPGVVIAVVGFPVLVRGWVMRRHSIEVGRTNRSPVLLLALLWFTIELLGAFLQRRMYAYHFYPVLAPAGIVFGALARRDTPGRLLTMFAPLMLLSVLGAGEVIEHWHPQAHAATEFIRAHTGAGDRIWVDNGARLALETDRALGSRYALMFLFSNYDDAPLKYGRILLNDLQQRRPKFVLIPGLLDREIKRECNGWIQLQRSPVRQQRYAAAWHDVQDFVVRNYTPAGWIESDRVYRLR